MKKNTTIHIPYGIAGYYDLVRYADAVRYDTLECSDIELDIDKDFLEAMPTEYDLKSGFMGAREYFGPDGLDDDPFSRSEQLREYGEYHRDAVTEAFKKWLEEEAYELEFDDIIVD